MHLPFSIAILFSAALASAQTDKTAILLNLDVGYNTAYRNATWVPVDVYVDNTQSDLEGFVEVRVYDMAGNLQSPTYRVPASCPQNSKKRFRLYAWIDDASRVEAALYENDRLAVDTPAYLEPRPIDDEDFLAIVLDEDPMNYQFLYEALRPLEENPRISRHDVGSSELALLPENLACYTAIDFILVGDVDLSRVPPITQRLLLDYVETGGTLVVFTGVNAQRVRGSWLAPHLGVEIESFTTQPEALYRANLFEDPAPSGYDESRLCTAATLAKIDPTVTVFGSGATLAARRPLGNGEIVTFATDTASQALQTDPRYIRLWTGIFNAAANRESRLDLDSFDTTFINNLPQVSGVSIRPVEHVLIYLALYIGVGIVLNWLFWSRLKRREFAWLTLVVVSFAFTAYAVVSGTSGLDRRQSNHTISLLRLGPHSTLASEYTILGVLSARATTVNQPVAEKDALVREAGAASSAWAWGGTQNLMTRPFQFLEGPDPAVRGLRIGANEVRGYSKTRYRRFDGTIDGFVETTAGRPTVYATNNTGLDIESAVLFAGGQFYPLAPGELPNTFQSAANPTMHDAQMQPFENLRSGGYYPGGFYSSSWEDSIPYFMVSPLMDGATGVPNPYLGPFLIGRLAEPVRPSPIEIHPQHSSTLVMAELPYAPSRTVSYPLSHRLGGYGRFMFPRPWSENDWHGTAANQSLEFYFSVPPQLAGPKDAVLQIDLIYTQVEHCDLVLTAPGALSTQPVSLPVAAGQPHVLTRSYSISEWQSSVDENSGEVRLFVIRTDDGTIPKEQVPPVNVHVSAKLIAENAASAQEEWPGWQ